MKTLSKACLAGVVVLAFAAAGCGNDLETENSQLKAQIAALEQENQRLKEDNEELRGLVKDLRAVVDGLNKIVGKTLPEGKMAEAP